MTGAPPDYYFRIRDNGAAVFRVSTKNQQNRLELDEIASVNVKNGSIKPHGGKGLTPADQAAIALWLEERNALMARREMDDILRSIDHMNQTTHWAQSRASAAELEAVTDKLLMAMHDLRAVLVRKKSERVLSTKDSSKGAA